MGLSVPLSPVRLQTRSRGPVALERGIRAPPFSHHAFYPRGSLREVFVDGAFKITTALRYDTTLPHDQPAWQLPHVHILPGCVVRM